MPSTARVNIAQRNTSQTVTEMLDDVWDTQYGKHMTWWLPTATDTSVPWPTTGELYVYISVSVPSNATGTISIKSDAISTPWVANLPSAGLKTPFLLPMPTSGTVVLNASVDAEASLVFF